MSSNTARVIDLESYRRRRAEQPAQELATRPVYWMPVWFWVPLWQRL